MALADIIFSDNPKRREKLAFLRAKLSLLIDKCCEGTNKLIGIIENYLPKRKFTKIYADKSKDIRYNCDLIIERIQEIQSYLEEENLKLKQYLGTELFQRLVSIDTSFEETIVSAKRWMLVSKCGFTLGAIIVPILIQKKNLFPVLTQSLTHVSGFAIAFAIISVGVVFEVVGSIVIGISEKISLEKAIQEFEESIAIMEPGAETFCENIYRVWARIETLPK